MAQEESISKVSNDSGFSIISDSINKSNVKPALIPFIVSGYPNFETTKALLKLFEEKKVAAIELGVPFSDPLADGPIIQKASKASLENGTNINKIFAMLEEINEAKDGKEGFSTPIILFTYYNPVLSFGAEAFIRKAALLNVSGVIIPDLPLEECEELSRTCKESNIDLIMLVSPTSNPERIEKIARASSGFIYIVSSTGVTGVRDTFSDMLENILQEVKKHTKTPVAVGFGISTAEHIRELQNLGADAAIIGSALIKIIEEYVDDIDDKDDQTLLIEKMSEYLDSLYA